MGTSGIRWEDWGECREGKKMLVEEMTKGNENFSCVLNSYYACSPRRRRRGRRRNRRQGGKEEEEKEEE